MPRGCSWTFHRLLMSFRLGKKAEVTTKHMRNRHIASMTWPGISSLSLQLWLSISWKPLKGGKEVFTLCAPFIVRQQQLTGRRTKITGQRRGRKMKKTTREEEKSVWEISWSCSVFPHVCLCVVLCWPISLTHNTVCLNVGRDDIIHEVLTDTTQFFAFNSRVMK